MCGISEIGPVCIILLLHGLHSLTEIGLTEIEKRGHGLEEVPGFTRTSLLH